MTREDKINYVNIGLIAISAMAALGDPFQLFVFVYAVLGPLHYLTELSWLHDRKYFTADRHCVNGLWLLASGLTLTGIFMSAGAATFGLTETKLEWTWGLLTWTALMLGILACFTGNKQKAIGGMALLILILLFAPVTFVSQHASIFQCALLFATIVITLIHIFVFTWCFMLAGALRSKRISGFISLVFFSICASALFFAKGPHTILLNKWVIDALKYFDRLDLLIANLAGCHQPEQITAIMRFVAFAYTYHYLNWFSKTQIIQWHKIPRRALAIGLLYVSSLCTFAVDYGLGYRVILFFSLSHVFLEFPLDVKTILSLGNLALATHERNDGALINQSTS